MTSSLEVASTETSPETTTSDCGAIHACVSLFTTCTSAPAPTPAVLLAGAYHVRRDLGVPLHLADLGAARGVRVLQLAEAGQAIGAGEADYVWFTPGQPQHDRCAALRARQSGDGAKKDPARAGSKP